MGSDELTERSRRLLATLVREYIETGEPVSSQVVAHRSGLGVSSATVRNVLAQLEDAGYVHQPHTSAGRVPTDRGYRAFVDLLLEARKPARSPAGVENQLRQPGGRKAKMKLDLYERTVVSLIEGIRACRRPDGARKVAERLVRIAVEIEIIVGRQEQRNVGEIRRESCRRRIVLQAETLTEELVPRKRADTHRHRRGGCRQW